MSVLHLPLSLLHFWDHACIFFAQPGFEAPGRRNLSSSSQGAFWHSSSQLQGVMLIGI
jgi:hypothetical protein